MSYSKFHLPALKLTKRPTIGDKSVDILQRSHPSATELPNQASPYVHTASFEELLPSTSGEFGEPTEHELACKASVAGWKGVQEELRVIVTQSAAMPPGQLCFCEEAACLRCQQCGPRGFFCSPCFTKVHGHINIFHVPEKWEVRYTFLIKCLQVVKVQF